MKIAITVEEIAAAAKSRIIQELGDTVGKGAAQMIGQVVEWSSSMVRNSSSKVSEQDGRITFAI